MLKNKYINALVTFVKDHINNFQEILMQNPYSLKSIKNCPYNPSWYMFNYNLLTSDLKNDVVRACRGTVLSISKENNEVKPISAPYTKFFNYGTDEGNDIDKIINWKKAQISLKIDGILIKTACVEENKEKHLYFFTNGSFNLNAPFYDTNLFDEADTRGMQSFGDLLRYALNKVDDTIKINFDKKNGSFYITGGWSDKIPLGSTLMFELVSPRNKIVCKYLETKLYLHGYRDPDLIEFNPRELNFGLKFDLPEIYTCDNLEDLKKLIQNFNGAEKEGCVIVDYSNPETPRAKIKCESYLKLKFSPDNKSMNQLIFKAVVFEEYDDLAVPAIIPKIEEIKEEINKFKNWYINESKKVSEICKGNNNRENYRIWALWCKKNVHKFLLPIYLLMVEEDSLMQLDKKLEFFATKDNGYNTFLKFLGKIK